MPLRTLALAATLSLALSMLCRAAGQPDAAAEAKKAKDRSDRIRHFLTLSDNKQYAQIIKDFDAGKGLDDDFAILTAVAQSHEKLGHNAKAADFYCRSAVAATASRLPGRSNDALLLDMAAKLDPKNPCIEASKADISRIKSAAKQ